MSNSSFAASSSSRVSVGSRYRPEIDGLRAVAVLPVLFFHAGLRSFSGGYIGVDVFFVISGYLITTIIDAEIRNGALSIIRFYERRIRRILPALFTVCIACVPFAWLWMLPEELKHFARSLVAVNLFSSNLLFWQETDYFAAPAELKPLLHTWSLAVEEQFYLFFPLLMVLLARRNKAVLLTVLFSISLSSLMLAEWASQAYPSANFYFLPSRAWELGVGAILASSRLTQIVPPRWIAQLGSIAGIAAILFSIFKFDVSVPFPGFWALVPVLGTALVIICANPSTIVGRILNWRPIVGVGLISYSVYLWHQPVLAFARIRLVDHVPITISILLCGISIGLGYLSWRFIERPYRQRETISRTNLCYSGAIAAIFLVTFGLVGHFAVGFPNRRENVTAAAKALDVNYGLSETCNGHFTLSSDCRTSSAPEILVWGDSYAMHLVDGIVASNPNAALIQMTTSVCGPFLKIAPVAAGYPESWANDCLSFNRHVEDWVHGQNTVRFAVLSSPFWQYVGNESAILYQGKVIHNPPMTFVSQQLDDTLSWLADQGITPVVFAPPPTDGQDVGGCLLRSKWLGLDDGACNISISAYHADQENVIQLLHSIQQNHRVIWLSKELCGEAYCAARIGGIFIYRDGMHLSHEGSRYIGKAMDFYHLITSFRDPGPHFSRASGRQPKEKDGVFR